MQKYNYYGENITNCKIKIIDDTYGYIDDNNIPHINWCKESDSVDTDGFDKTYRTGKGPDLYLIEDYILPKGMMICRYGFSGGRFTTVKGTDYLECEDGYLQEDYLWIQKNI